MKLSSLKSNSYWILVTNLNPFWNLLVEIATLQNSQLWDSHWIDWILLLENLQNNSKCDRNLKSVCKSEALWHWHKHLTQLQFCSVCLALDYPSVLFTTEGKKLIHLNNFKNSVQGSELFVLYCKSTSTVVQCCLKRVLCCFIKFSRIMKFPYCWYWVLKFIVL